MCLPIAIVELVSRFHDALGLGLEHWALTERVAPRVGGAVAVGDQITTTILRGIRLSCSQRSE